MMRRDRFARKAAALTVGAWLIGLAAGAVYAQDAKALYEKSCNSCHGPSGKGDGPAGQKLKPPPGDLGSVVKKASDADLAKIIKEGGKAVGRSPAMPAYGSKLKDDQVNGLVQYVKGFSSK